MENFRKREKGASLVELIVVIAIIAIISSIAIVSYTMFIKRAKIIKAEQELIQVYNLIYMEADQNGFEIGTNSNGDTALYVSTSGNKIVLIYNDSPQMYPEDNWDIDDILNWQDEEKWNNLLRDLIDVATDDIGMFSGKFELDPKEDIAIFNSERNEVEVVSIRNLTYILENKEDLRSRKEIIVTTLKDVETTTRFLSDLEASRGNLVPKGRIRDGFDDVEELNFELWFVWTAAAGFVKHEEFSGTLDVTYQIYLENTSKTAEELETINQKLKGEEEDGVPLFMIQMTHSDNKIISDYPDVIEAKIWFNREPFDRDEYDLLQDEKTKIKIIFTINITDVRIKSGDND